MATFGTPSKLEDLFGGLADRQTDLYRTQRAPVRNRKVSELAATGRLSSGIAEHSLGALDQDTALGESQIRSAVIPQVGSGILQDDSQQFQDEQAQKEFERNVALAKLVGERNKPSKLSQAFQGISSVAQLGAGIGGLMTGNPLLAMQGLNGVKGIADMAGGGGGGGDDSALAGMFGQPSSPLSMYNRDNYPQKRYF